MQDRPIAGEPTEAASGVIGDPLRPSGPASLVAHTDGDERPGLLERELAWEEPLLKAEYKRLVRLLGKDQEATPDSLEGLKEGVIELSQDLGRTHICSGEMHEGAFERLRRAVADKREVASLRYLERHDRRAATRRLRLRQPRLRSAPDRKRGQLQL